MPVATDELEKEVEDAANRRNNIFTKIITTTEITMFKKVMNTGEMRTKEKRLS